MSCGAMNQIVACCCWTMSTSESEWPMITTPRTAKVSETSYETICAQVRIEPSSANLEWEAQPPTMKP